VGSLPIQDDFDESRKNTDQAILDKVSVGLDYPCYPQLLGSPSKPMNMALQFLIPLAKAEPSIQIRGEETRLLSEDIRIPSEAIGVERAEHFVRFLSERGLADRVRGVKASITGPFTLASYLNKENLMTCGASRPKVVRTLAQTLTRSCERVGDLGFDIVGIDEPFLSVMLGRKVLFGYDEGFVVEMLNLLINAVSGVSAVHVCGRVTPLVRSVLLETDADVIDHEFAGSPANLQAYTRDDFERTGKLLAFGCVSSVDPKVESVEEISSSLRTALKTFGPRIIVKPDCGFGGTLGFPGAYESVLKKLGNMVRAARVVAAEA